MSGPIIRKYGFPNFDKIFGERPLQHGVEDSKEEDKPETTRTRAGEAESKQEPEERSRK
jgi:hypothetical protein